MRSRPSTDWAVLAQRSGGVDSEAPPRETGTSGYTLPLEKATIRAVAEALGATNPGRYTFMAQVSHVASRGAELATRHEMMFSAPGSSRGQTRTADRRQWLRRPSAAIRRSSRLGEARHSDNTQVRVGAPRPPRKARAHLTAHAQDHSSPAAQPWPSRQPRLGARGYFQLVDARDVHRLYPIFPQKSCAIARPTHLDALGPKSIDDANTPQPCSVSVTTTSTGLAVAQKMEQTSGTSWMRPER